MSRIRFLGLAALAATGTLALAACTSGSPSGDQAAAAAGAGGLTPITVGVLPIAPSAAVQYGIDEGIFEEHGFDVTVQVAEGGAAMLPAVSTGQIDFGIGNPMSVLLAAAQGVDVRVATGYSFALAEGDDINAVITRAGEGIDSWSDLEGKRVSVNAVNNLGDLTIMESVAMDGGDPTSVEFIEVGFPDALAQLDADNVDAVWVPEPFMSQAIADPDTYSLLGFPNQNVIAGTPTMLTFTSSATAEDGDKLSRWRAAIAATLDAAGADPEGFSVAVAGFTGMPEEAAAELRLERLSAELDAQVLAEMSALAVEHEFMAAGPDLDALVLP